MGQIIQLKTVHQLSNRGTSSHRMDAPWLAWPAGRPAEPLAGLGSESEQRLRQASGKGGGNDRGRKGEEGEREKEGEKRGRGTEQGVLIVPSDNNVAASSPRSHVPPPSPRLRLKPCPRSNSRPRLTELASQGSSSPQTTPFPQRKVFDKGGINSPFFTD